jgi:hypothetical protein
MAKTKVVIHNEGIRDLLAQNKDIRDLLIGEGQKVQANAQATASAAEKGPGGRLDGYASAGFKVSWANPSAGRPRVEVTSQADIKTATGVHFFTQKRDGVAHMRAALYKITTRG